MDKFEKIFKRIDEIDRDKVMEIMRALINISTVTPPGNNYREYVDVISKYFKKLDYELEEVVQPEELIDQIPYHLEGPRINLIATKDLENNKEITFYGHMDVVPASEEEDKWRFPPFEATMIKSGKIYGRGVADMKGAMACLILALQIIEEEGLKPKYNIRIVNCTDEELGVYPGVKYLAEKGYIKGTVWCMEGIVNPIMVAGAAGDLDVEVKTIGKSAHSGMNFMGVNALEEMIPILNELMELKKKVEQRESKDIPGFPRFGTGEQRNMTPMFNLDIIRAGEKSNILPGECDLTINRRIIPDEKYEDVKNEIREAIKRGKEKSKALDIKVEYKYEYPPLKMDVNAPDIKRLKEVIKIVQDVSEDRIQTIGFSASTDMGFVSEILNTNDIIFYGVGNAGSDTHGVNETIRLKDIKTFIKEIILYLCGDL